MQTAKRGHRQKKGRPADMLREMLQQVNIEPTPATMRRMKRAAATGDATRVQQLVMALMQESGSLDLAESHGGSTGAERASERADAAGRDSSDDEAPPPDQPPQTDSEEEPPPACETSDDEAPPPPQRSAAPYVPRCELQPQRKTRRHRTKAKRR